VSDDLVVRLRERCKWYRERAQEHQHVAALREARNVEALLLEEAADEIERLQSDLAAQGDAAALPRFSADHPRDCSCDKCNEARDGR
jgi:hypothetical protein